MKIILMVGISGSGKSTLARSIFDREGGVILSTDDILMDSTKSAYLWNGSLLPAAHQLNQKKAEIAMKRKISPIIIDNTNLGEWEREPYIKLAQENEYDVEIREPDTPWKYNIEECVGKNIHGVPQVVIERQLEKLKKEYF